MRVNEANIFLFIATIIIGILIAMNFNLDGKERFLDVEQYEVAYNERLKLQNEIGDLEKKYDELSNKIEKYESGTKTGYEVMGDMYEETRKNKMSLGLLPVEGDGIKITLNDSLDYLSGKTTVTPNMLIHDYDLIRVINDLRSAGAEAISVNGYRITYSSSTLCVGSTISLDKIKIGAPFSIIAIGDKEAMKTYLETQDNYVNKLKLRTCFVEVEPVHDVKIQSYTKSMSVQYLRQK
ncbi:MAG: DUF881 domain-containing protein [Clostridium sp.]|nr:DUF881 domain-containing protein [Clostridium sp.]